MNRIIACTALGLLGAGSFCAQAEPTPVPTDGKPVPEGKARYSVTPGLEGEKQDAKTGTVLVTVKSVDAEKSASAVTVTTTGNGVVLTKAVNAGPEKAMGARNAAYSVTTVKGTAPGEMEIRVTPRAEGASSGISAVPPQEGVFITRKAASLPGGSGKEGIFRIKPSAVEPVREAAYSIKTEGSGSEKLTISVAPGLEKTSSGGAAVPAKGDVVVTRAVVTGNAKGVKDAAYSVTVADRTAPGEAEISVTPKQEEASSGTPAAPVQGAAEKDDRAVVQIALLLDTSSSMNGLIDQARTYLWKIVNDMTLARQNGKLPDIRLALYEYGNDGLSSRDAWIRRVLPFTDDLDKVSEELFKLKTYGGTECCGAVIDRAVKELKWNTDDPHALKLVFIAGNEPFNQGSVPYAEAIARGLERGITVNTIHCGNAGDSDTRLWKDGAKKGDGSFLNIDHNAAPPDPETPFDGELAKLSSSLNATYLAYGSPEVQAERLSKQERQDTLALKLSPAAAVGRASAKANKAAYSNTSWDLVDFYDRNGVQALGDLGTAGQLPKELEGKTAEEVEAIVKKKAEERGALQKKVKELDAQRNEWLAKWKQQSASRDAKPNTLEDAIIQAVRQQASKKQFSFVEENETEGKDSPMNDRVKK